MNNLILLTDSYKINHWNQYPDGTEGVYSYLEARKGAQYPETVFFGLQYLLKEYLCKPVEPWMIEEAHTILSNHFMGSNLLYDKMWDHIINKYGGYLPLKIMAVPEGLPVPINNVLLTIQNTDPICFPLTNFVESLILNTIWGPTTTSTISRRAKLLYKDSLDLTSDNPDAIMFMLHDFGFRGVSSVESAMSCGAGHLVNFKGTDTIPALKFLNHYYNADYSDIAFSVPATEHSVMTSMGEEGEEQLFNDILDKYPTGILSVVADSYNIERFVTKYVKNAKNKIMARPGKLVIRPDSLRDNKDTPEKQMLWLFGELCNIFGYSINSKGCKVMDDHVGALWGDGLALNRIDLILRELVYNKYSVESMVNGMGGGLLQKINRDTMRFAIKSSAQFRNNKWNLVHKNPLEAAKGSKAGFLGLFRQADGSLSTKNIAIPKNLLDATPPEYEDKENILRDVFYNGELLIDDNLTNIRNRAVV